MFENHYKDGEARDKRGRWAGKVVTVRREFYELIETWQKQTGMSKAEFWRQAVMRGALEVARSYGIDASYPALQDEKSARPADMPKKRGFPFWGKKF